MLLLRGLIFTLLVPCLVGGLLPYLFYRRENYPGGLWNLGWLLVVAGSAIYVLCFLRFLTSGGTPAIFFTRHLKSVIGEEPPKLVSEGLYRISRNPMYIGVLTAVFGQVILFSSVRIAIYGIFLWLCFHLAVVIFEEPHLRKERGPAYEEYCRQVPRWLGWPK
jgi:protein-S-isoprenylcysteine O-methyltransferase Ste14